MSTRLPSALPSVLLAAGSLALLLAIGAGHIDLIGILDAIPSWLRHGGALLVGVLSTWRTVVHFRRATATSDETHEGGLARVRHLTLALRAGLLGLSAVALVSGWLTDSDTLVGLALVIGLEELYETTIVLGILDGVRTSDITYSAE